MVFFFTATFHKRVNSRLQSRASGRKGSKRDTQAPRFEIFRAGATRESLGAGRRQPPLCDWWSFLGPASWGAAPLPSEAGLGDYAKSHCPAPRPDWRPLFAAQLQETTPRGSGQQVRPGEGLTGGLGRVPAPCWVSVSLSGQWGGRVDCADGPRSTGTVLLSVSPTWKPHARAKKDRCSGNGKESWTGDLV